MVLAGFDSVNSDNTESSQPCSWWALAGVLGLMKLVIFVLDSNPQVVLGDSMSYLATAIAQSIPPDRSFLYGFLIHNLTTRARSLSSLVAVQTFAGIATALITAAVLVRFFRVSFRMAAAIAMAIAIEPQQLLYERFVLTESLSTAVFAGLLFLGLEYIHSRRMWALAATQIAGVLLIALRMTYLPVVVATTVVAPILTCLTLKRRSRQVGIHLVVSLTLFAALHSAYRRWNGYVSNLPPAYIYADGFFLIGTVSPLVRPVDTANPQLVPVLSQPLAYATGENRILARNAELYWEEGLVGRMKAVLKDDYQANLEAKRIAYRTILRDPAGVVRLAMQTYLLFYSREHMSAGMRGEAGMRELEAGQLNLLSLYHLDARGLPFMKTITRQYYLASLPWFLVLLHSPLALLACAFAARPGTRRLMWFLALMACLPVGTAQLLQVEPSTRYLHSVTVLFAIAIGVFASGFFLRTGRKTET